MVFIYYYICYIYIIYNMYTFWCEVIEYFQIVRD